VQVHWHDTAQTHRVSDLRCSDSIRLTQRRSPDSVQDLTPAIATLLTQGPGTLPRCPNGAVDPACQYAAILWIWTHVSNGFNRLLQGLVPVGQIGLSSSLIEGVSKSFRHRGEPARGSPARFTTTSADRDR